MTPCLLCVNILLLKMYLKNFGGSATKTSYEAFTKILTIWKTHVRHFTVLINAHRGMQHNPSYPRGARVEKVVFPKDTFKIHIPSISSALKKKKEKKTHFKARDVPCAMGRYSRHLLYVPISTCNYTYCNRLPPCTVGDEDREESAHIYMYIKVPIRVRSGASNGSQQPYTYAHTTTTIARCSVKYIPTYVLPPLVYTLSRLGQAHARATRISRGPRGDGSPVTFR